MDWRFNCKCGDHGFARMTSSFSWLREAGYPATMSETAQSIEPTTTTQKASEELENHCFGCGASNPQGLHLHFVIHGSDPNAISASATIQLTCDFEGPPGYIHGGIIATMLDEAMSKLNKPLDLVAMTRHMEVDYLRPVRVGDTLTIVSKHIRREGRKIFHTAEITGSEGKVLAQGEALFVVIDPALITRKH